MSANPPEGQQPNPSNPTAANPSQPPQNSGQGLPASDQGTPQVGPDGQPLQSGAPQLGLDGQPLQGGYPQVGPDGQPLYQGAPQLGPDGQPLYQGAPQLGPDGQPLQGGYPQVGPDGQPLQGGYPQVGPDGQPLYQGAPQLGPDGQPLPQGGYLPPPGGFMPGAPEQPKKAGVGRRILFGIIAAVVAIGVSIAVRSGVFDTPKMKAGDCVQREGEDSVKVVTCGTPEAQYSVLGIVEKQSRYSGQAGACNPYPDTTTIYWEGRNNSSGTVYCLKKL